MAERRRFSRVSRPLVTYVRRLDDEALERAGLARDLSLGGILVELEPAPALDEFLALEMVLAPGTPPVNLVARVVRVDQEGTGLEFVRVDPGDRERLERFVRDRIPGQTRAGDGA